MQWIINPESRFSRTPEITSFFSRPIHFTLRPGQRRPLKTRLTFFCMVSDRIGGRLPGGMIPDGNPVP